MKRAGFFRNGISLVIIFSLIYDISFSGLNGFTTARLAFLFLVFTNVSRLDIIIKEYGYFLLFMIAVMFLALVQSFYSHDTTQLSSLFFFIIYCLASSLLVNFQVGDSARLQLLFLSAISFQSLVLIYVFFNPSLKLVLSNYIITGANYGPENLYRSFGLTSSSGAALSLIQGLGFGLGLYMLHTGQKRYRWAVLIMSVLCISSTIFVGRTGLVVSIIFLAAYVSISLSILSIIKYGLVFLVISYFSVGGILERNLQSIKGFSTDYFFTWISEGIQIRDNKTANALMNEQPIPELTFQTLLIGTGTVSVDGQNTSGHDSGYVQTYYSLGLVLTFLFYLLVVHFMKSHFRSRDNRLLYFLIMVMLLLEAKEPFLFKYREGFIIFSLLFSLHRGRYLFLK